MQGREQAESKGLFCQAGPAHFPGDAWLYPARAGAGRAAPRSRCGVGVLQLLTVEQNSNTLGSSLPCHPTVHLGCFSVWQTTGEGATIRLT